MLNELRQFLVNWGNTFPLDKWFRDKYKLPFHSEGHLQASQADILMEYIECQLYEDYSLRTLESIKKEGLLKKGEWLSKDDSVEDIADEDWDKIEI